MFLSIPNNFGQKSILNRYSLVSVQMTQLIAKNNNLSPIKKHHRFDIK